MHVIASLPVLIRYAQVARLCNQLLNPIMEGLLDRHLHLS